MLTEKMAATLSEEQLRQLIKMQGKRANKNLAKIRQPYKSGKNKVDINGVTYADLSGVFAKKINPYLQKHGTKSGGFVLNPKAGTKKKDLITELLNIQYYNEKIGTPADIIRRAENTANEYGVDIENQARFWELVRKGFDAVGYRVDSDSILKIVSERMRAGQTGRGIKAAITRAANAADSGDDYIARFSKGGKWL